MVDDAIVAGDLFGLAREHDRHFDLDRDVAADAQEVDMQHVALDRVALHLLHDRQLGRVPVDLEVDECVHTGVGGQRVAQLSPVDAHRDGVAAEPVDGGGHLAFRPQAVTRS